MISKHLRLLLLSIFIVCSAKAQTAVDMNNTLIASLDTLYQLSGAWRSHYNKIDKDTKHYADLKTERTAWEQYTTRKIEEIKALKDVGGSAKYRGSVYMMFLYHKQTIANLFLQFEKLNERTTITQIAPYKQKLVEVSGKQKEFQAKILEEQKIYAHSNKFELE